MKSNMRPWAAVGGILMLAFVVWLFSSMAGTERANQILLTLAVCAIAIAVAMFLGIRVGSRDEREDERRRT